MALITEIVPQQGFEIVLNKLGAILLTEIANQVTLQSLPDSVEIYIERTEPFDKSEDVMINVSCNNINFQGQQQAGSQGDTTFYVDIQTTGVESSVMSGNDDVRMKLHRYLGIIRYVLNSTKYKTLELPRPLVTGVNVNSVQFDDNYGKEDGSFNRMCRVTVGIRINEVQEMWDSILLEGNDTTVKLDLTDKGYRLIFNNNN